MSEFIESIKTKGEIEILVQYDGRQDIIQFPNTTVLTGRRALALSLVNQIGPAYNFYVTRMLFGDGGTQNGVKKLVTADRNGLFGVTRLSKPVLANIDINIPTQAIFTTVIAKDEGVGVTLNEMALQMSTGDLYSMATFPDLNKTSDIQLVINWKLNFI